MTKRETDRLVNRLIGVTRGYLRNREDQEDAAMEGIYSALRAGWDQVGTAYTIRAACHRSIEIQRRQKRRPEVSLIDTDAPCASSDKEISLVETCLTLRPLIGQLDSPDKQVLQERFEGVPFADPERKSRLCRARKKIREMESA